MRHVALVGLLLAGTAAAQQRVSVEAPVYVTAIEVVADVRDARGQVPSGLTAEDFVITEEGIERPVIGVDYLSARRSASDKVDSRPGSVPAINTDRTGWQIVIFFDLHLSSPATIGTALKSFHERASELARLGHVSIAVSDPAVKFLLIDSRDEAAIRTALQSVSATSARNWLVRHRRQYQLRTDLARGRPMMTDLSVMAQARAQPEFIRSEIMAEVDAIGRFQYALLTAVGRFPRWTPRALFVVSEGFELDISSFYLKFSIGLEEILAVRGERDSLDLGQSTEALARVLAASGWTTIGVHAPLGGGEQWLDDAGRSSVGRASEPRAREATYSAERGHDPLLAFAAETGGSAGTAGMIGGSVTGLDEKLIITYQVSRPPDGQPRRIEVRSKRPGLTIKAFRWATESTPSELAASRTLALLSEPDQSSGDIPTDVSLKWMGRIGPRREGEITVTSALTGIEPVLAGRQTVFRVTIVISRKNMPPNVFHRMITPKETGPSFTIRVPIESGEERLEVAATVEELTSGLWGGAKASL